MRRLRLAPLGALAATAALLYAGWHLASRVLGAYRAVEVAGESMTPALRPGDFVLLRRTLLGRTPQGRTLLGRTLLRRATSSLSRIAYGRVVATRDGEGRLLLKRVIGLPGESLRVGARVEVNGRTLIEPYAHGETPPAQYRGVARLGPDQYFLLGDNRAASTDSRDFGAVHASQLEGAAWLRYWPPGRIGVLRRPRRQFEPPA